MASASLKGTRKTYSFEERKILISLISKHKIVEDRKPDPFSICTRKSAWLQIAEEYNSMVGHQGTRSAVQLRRCWENMKACKRNREEKKVRDSTKVICQSTKDEIWARKQYWEDVSCGQNTPEVPTSTGTIGLPPNVVFEPKDSELLTLQSFCTARPLNLTCSQKDSDSCKDLVGDAFRQIENINGNECDAVASPHVAMSDYQTFVKRNADSLVIDQSVDDDLEKTSDCDRANLKPSTSHTVISPSIKDHNRKRKFSREEELHILALSEAQMKVDIAAMLKEETRTMLDEARYRKDEARIKLEEAHYRREEARLRMLFFCSQTGQN